MRIRDRIKELRRVKACEIEPNPKNWRTHPDDQRAAVQGTLAEIGYADALIAYEPEPGRLRLIDGHLRAETTPDQDVPVLVLDVDEAEADKLLATMDPLAGLADANAEALRGLLDGVDTDSDALRQMLDDLGGVVPDPGAWDDMARALGDVGDTPQFKTLTLRFTGDEHDEITDAIKLAKDSEPERLQDGQTDGSALFLSLVRDRYGARVDD